jgi:hypothetical protein
MKTIKLPERELFDEQREEFVNVPAVTLRLEHSLLAISKWETEYEIPFLETLKKKAITDDQFRYYIQCMCLDEVDPISLVFLDGRILEEIVRYINKSCTATTIKEDKSPKRNRVVTSEQIYCWMTIYGIPFECEKWNLNRLTTLIRVCQEEAKKANGTKKKPNMSERRAKNLARRKKLGSRG